MLALRLAKKLGPSHVTLPGDQFSRPEDVGNVKWMACMNKNASDELKDREHLSPSDEGHCKGSLIKARKMIRDVEVQLCRLNNSLQTLQ